MCVCVYVCVTVCMCVCFLKGSTRAWPGVYAGSTIGLH